MVLDVVGVEGHRRLLGPRGINGSGCIAGAFCRVILLVPDEHMTQGAKP